MLHSCFKKRFVKKLIFFKKLKSDRRAIMLPMFAAMLAFLGLLFDGGRIYFEKRRMQVAADAGARGGALELLRSDTSTYVDSGGKDDTALNGFVHGQGTVSVTINNPPSTQAAGIYQNAGCVEAIVTQGFPTTLMRIASANSASVSTRATACIQPDLDPPCILSLYCGDEQPGLTFNGTGELVANDCDVVINSQADDAILFNGTGSCPPEHLQVTGSGSVWYGNDGGVLQNGANDCISCGGCEDGEPLAATACFTDPYCEGLVLASPNYPGSCAPLADPWPIAGGTPTWSIGNITNGTYLDVPDSFPACPVPGDSSGGPCFDSTALPAENGYVAGALLLPPGYYDGKGVIITGGRVIFDCDDTVAGCLYLGSQLSINGGTVLADGVTYYITPDGSPASAGLNIGGNAGDSPDTVSFSAPTGSGTYQNIAFFSSRYTTEKDCIVTGGSNLFVEGVIYCPTGTLEFGGNTGLTAGTDDIFAQLIGYTIELSGTPNLEVNFGATGRTSGFNIIAMVE